MVAEAKYILMNKHKPALEFSYDLDTHSVLKISDIYDLRYAPPGILDFKGSVTRRTLNNWWHARAIPASRDQIRNLLENIGVQSSLKQLRSSNQLAGNQTLLDHLQRRMLRL